MRGWTFSRRTLFRFAAAMGATAAFPRVLLSDDGKVLRVRVNRDIQILDPAFMTGGPEQWSQFCVFTQLANYAPKDEWGWVPGLMVEEIGYSDNLTIRFKLRPGFQWSNGYGEVTAEDVKYSLERLRLSEWKDKVAVLDHVEVKNAHEGMIVFKKPFAPFWLTTLCDGVGSVVCKKAVEEKGYQTDSALRDGTKLKRFDAVPPAICGPYEIVEWTPKQHIYFGPNPAWIGPKPGIEQVRFIVVEDEKPAELGYEAGDLDITWVGVATVPRYKAKLPPNSKFKQVAGTAWTWLGMNTEHPKLQNHQLCEAICWAVDVEAILQASYSGLSPRSYGIVPPGLIGHREKSKFMNRDVEKAKTLVTDAGAQGLALDVKIINKTDMINAASIVKANLEEIGINLEIIPLDSGTWWDLGLESRGDAWKDLQLYIARFGDSPDPSQMAQWYVSSQVGIWNWERWRNPEYDKMFEEGLTETDPTKRDRIYVRMQEIMDDTAAYVWITHEPIPIIHRDTVEPVIFPDGEFFTPGFKWA